MAVDAAPPTFRLEDLLAEGRDPRAVLARAAEALPEGGGLILDAPFDPQPLRQALDGHRLRTRAVAQSNGRWHLHVDRPAPPPDTTDEGPAGRFSLEDGVLTLDVRGLPPPRPLEVILRVLDGGLAGGELVVRAPHAPARLLDAVAARGWAWEIVGQDKDGATLLLTRIKSAS